MRILYICRLYTGFESSLKSRIWAPKGTPTIAKMIEYLDASKDFDLDLVLTCKDYNSTWAETSDRTIKIEGLNTPIQVLAGKQFFPNWLWKFQEKLSDLRQSLKLWKIIRKTQPDIIYCDRVNLLPAALFARFTRIPVIWRIMGILEHMKKDLKSYTARAALMRFLYRSPFKTAICTLEGSGGGPWMKQALHPDTAQHLLINGIDFNLGPAPIKELPKGPIKVLFAGRLEPIKGAEQFIKTMIEVVQNNPDYHAVIAGDGSLKSTLEKHAEQSGLGNHFSFLGSISPAQLKYVRQQCDLYVSLNTQGNLSNVNLEALSDGMIVIVPTSQTHLDIDIDTDRFIPDNVFYRFGQINDLDRLKAAILYFSDTNQKQAWKSRAHKFGHEFLKTWDQRIVEEIEIYHSTLQSAKKSE